MGGFLQTFFAIPLCHLVLERHKRTYKIREEMPKAQYKTSHVEGQTTDRLRRVLPKNRF
jgi:hypothetical protein